MRARLLGLILGLMAPAPAQLLGQAAPGTPPPQSFWEANGDKIVVGVVTAIVVLVFSETIKSLLKRLEAWIERAFEGIGWRFRKRYLAALANRHRWLKLIGIYHSADLHLPRLQEVYVSLRLAAAKAADAPRSAWPEIFQLAEKKLVILGSPGAGKSTLLDYLVLVFTGHIRHSLRERLGRPFPMYARLRELGDSGAESLPELLAKSVPLKKIPSSFPDGRLKKGGSIVLLDGLDEVLDAERHARAVEEIERLAAEYPDNRYVVTCRVAGWKGQLPDFRTYEVQPFSPDDIREFIGAWYREVLRKKGVDALGAAPKPESLKEAEAEAYTEARERSDELRAALEHNESLLGIATTPLLLSLITLIHFHRRTDLPKGRARLYEQCVDILVDLWDRQDKRLRLPEVPTLKEKRLVLEAIAFHFLKENLLEADMAALKTVVEPVLPRIQASLNTEQLIRQILERSGILQEQRLGMYGFAHRALHDDLAAAYIVSHELDSLLLERVAEERWREVILIAAGLAPPARSERLVGALLSLSSESAAELEVAGLALAEDIQLGADLRAEVRRRLLERLGREEALGSYQRLSAALMTADLEAAVGFMEAELRGHDPTRRSRVLSLVAASGTTARPLLPLLTRLVEDEREDSRIRAQAAMALSEVKVAEFSIFEALRKARESNRLDLKSAAAWAWCELGRAEELRLVKIPAGEFVMGSREIEGDESEWPQHTVYLPAFYIGRNLVTAAEYLTTVAQRTDSGVEGPGTLGKERLREANKLCDHPVVEVTWFDALAYARWHGFTLPSEAEWEKAARGTDGRSYPWDDEWREGCANTWEYWHHGRAKSPGRLARRRHGEGGTTTPVGSFPQGESPYGCADMAGNVWEWTRSLWGGDWKSPSFRYPYSKDDGREALEAPSQVLRVLRGGAFANYSRSVRCAVRDRFDPTLRYWHIGFRVVLLPFSSGL